jgi:NDP-sugar pyrophosphorylase family protein
MQAVILAGGKGTRMQPYTTILPKPLMPINDKAILEIILMQLKNAGFKEFIFTVGHLAEIIQAYFRNGKKWGVKISYSIEDKPLGTVGPLTLIKNLAPQFLVMNGDILCDMDYRKFFDQHKRSNNDITICTYQKKTKIDLGVLEINEGKLLDYIEKPEYYFNVSMGIYGIKRKIVKNLTKRAYLDFPTLIKEKLEQKVRIGMYHFKGKWYDIGRIEDYQIAQEDFKKNAGEFLRVKKKG